MTDEVRPFAPRPYSPDTLREAVERVLGDIPEDKTVAVVAYADMVYGARLAAMVRLRGGWSFIGTLEKPYAGVLTAAAELRWTF